MTYLFGAFAWIVASDLVVSALHADTATVNIAKGVGFIIATSSMLFVLLRRHERHVAFADQRARSEVRELVDQSTEVVYVVDPSGRFLLVNRALAALVGIPPTAAVGRLRDDVFDGAAAAEHRRADAQVMATEQPIVAMEDFGDSLHRRRFRTTRFPIRNSAGRVTAIGCISVDTTDEERVQAQLRSSEAAYRTIFESSPVALWIHDEASKLMLAVNDAALAMYGYDEQQFLALHVHDLSPDGGDHLSDHDTRHGETGAATTTHVDARGRLIDVALDTTAAVYEGKRGVMVLARDVTEQRQAGERDRLLLELPRLSEQATGEDAFLTEVMAHLLPITRSTGASHTASSGGGELSIGRSIEHNARQIRVPVGDEAAPSGVVSMWGKPCDYTTADQIACRVVLLEAHRLMERARFVSDLEAAAHRQSLTLKGVARTVGAIIDARDPYTAGHQQRVGELAATIGRRLGLAEDEIEGLRIGGYVHDVGKIAIAPELLMRPGPLDEVERAAVQRHSRVGRDILVPVPFPWPIATMVDQHHERLDGSGYPEGLRGEEIILGARIIAVADVFDAITSTRPYRPGRSAEIAFDELRRGAGVRYDRDAVEALIVHVDSTTYRGHVAVESRG